MRVAIVGTGHVGLVTGACLAEIGHHVVCADTSVSRIAVVDRGESPFYEPGLSELVASGRSSGRLACTVATSDAVRDAQLVFLCVETPAADDGAIDLEPMRRAAAQVGQAWRGRTDRPVLAVKSTVVPGTTAGLVGDSVAGFSGLPAGSGFGLSNNPEFLSQGSAVADCLNPDRIIIGAQDQYAADMLLALYQPMDCAKLVTNLVNAELIKYAANAFQAALISFSNQIAGLCEAVPQADASIVLEGVHLDRIVAGSSATEEVAGSIRRFLKAGVGFGGSCFPKDLQALSAFARRLEAPSAMFDAVTAINRDRPHRVLDLLEAELGGLAGRHIAVLGLAFKPGTDDLRESPGLRLMSLLAARGARVVGHDPLPLARRNAAEKASGEIVDTLEEALAGADAALVATDWPDYAACDWQRLSGLMRCPVLLDGRYLLSAAPPGPPVRYRRIGVAPEGS